MPGMVDTHRHVWQGALGGCTGKHPLRGYAGAVVQGIAPHYAPEDVYAGTLWGALGALNAAITSIADWSHNLQSAAHADANVAALHHSGVRGIFLYGGPGHPPGALHRLPPRPPSPDDAPPPLRPYSCRPPRPLPLGRAP